MRHIHLDALGGIAGDMFIAALLDAFPEHEAAVVASIRAAAFERPVDGELLRHNDGVFQGRRFVVRDGSDSESRNGDAPDDSLGMPHAHSDAHDHSHDHSHTHAHAHGHSHAHGHAPPHHHHATWAAIRAHLEAAPIDGAVRHHALAIFAHLAAAEAHVHGMAVDAVAFHEVGAWDSIADIIGAAHLVAALGADAWTVSPLPLGSGRVRTAHGPLPVPAPATALLLEGFPVVQDGVGGERVTPTGAAIVRHLCTPGEPWAAPRVLSRSGVGFGTRTLAGVSNCVRVLVFDAGALDRGHDEVTVVEFEVDDQSAEDLAVGLERLRRHDAVLDVLQAPVFGKKGRVMTHVRLLAHPADLAAVIDACFRETTSIGLRYHVVQRATLSRTFTEVAVGARRVRVKSVDRPGGRTAKAEIEDVAAGGSQAQRARLRARAERAARDGDGRPA